MDRSALLVLPASNLLTTGSSTADVLRYSVRNGLITELAKQDDDFAGMLRGIVWEAVNAAITEETTDDAIDYALRFQAFPVWLRPFARPVLDRALPDVLLRLIRWALFRPSKEIA